ncbi:Na+/H+ antiporter NhaA [Nocardioides sp. W3-2-3]|uniref:Na+/H+ antiporter NhaA n=1 Tax=Nocardioides convexus TaxID=2712224 RepID=UPI002418779B|nr:Na+/H+ antiporter NhaA [Nocardioides convexus]NHA00883.1 Na+/H+ antiporter NhaA [Nocardioides convexus]
MTQTPPSPHQAPDDLWRGKPVWVASDRPLARYVGRPVREFLRVESAGSVLLLGATVLALLWVNLPVEGWASGYDHFWHTPLAVESRRLADRGVPAALGQRRPDDAVLLRGRPGDQARVRCTATSGTRAPPRCRSSPRSAGWSSRR